MDFIGLQRLPQSPQVAANEIASVMKKMKPVIQEQLDQGINTSAVSGNIAALAYGSKIKVVNTDHGDVVATWTKHKAPIR